MTKRVDTLTQSRLQELLNYDPLTGVFRWRISRQRVKAGNIAGSPVNGGYVQITIDGVRYLGNRLAFLYMTGEWPAGLADHRDSDPGNNRWANLRDATHAQNMKNRVAHRNNKSGFKGVYFDRKAGRYRAQIKVDGKKMSLGSFDLAEDAARAYDDAARQHHGDFSRLNFVR